MDKGKEYPGLIKGFEWKNVGSFSVITGKNGSEKTKLLEYISKNYQENVLRYIPVNYSIPTLEYLNEISSQAPYRINSDESGYTISDLNWKKIEWNTGGINQNAISNLDYDLT